MEAKKDRVMNEWMIACQVKSPLFLYRILDNLMRVDDDDDDDDDNNNNNTAVLNSTKSKRKKVESKRTHYIQVFYERSNQLCDDLRVENIY